MEWIINIVAEFSASPVALRWRITAAVLRAKRFLLELLPFLRLGAHPGEAVGINFANESDFLFLPGILSARQHLASETASLLWFLVVVGALSALFAVLAFGVSPLILLSAVIAFFYFSHALFKCWVFNRARGVAFLEASEAGLAVLAVDDLPVYTILIPLYREAAVVQQIRDAMTAIDYPVEKLDIIITLEAYDAETIEAIRAADFPLHFRTRILPDVFPKTKPKALNVALREARGEFVTIYDAEVIPEPSQLKKAVIVFRRHSEIDALQPRLDHYNAEQSVLTRLFSAEFAAYYDAFLPGLYQLGYPIPLSGHSVHFRTSCLRAVGGWDPYNVTEDCDLGIRLARNGCRAGILDSISHEEATARFGAWIRQRTRWMKGFLQTSIVHLRQPLRLKRELGGWKQFFAFIMTVPGTAFLNLLNLWNWALLILWFGFHPAFIEYFFPMPVLYISVGTAVLANYLFVYVNLLALHRRERFSLVKYSLLTPFYWVLLAVATVRAVSQLITAPSRWEKTEHGMHLRRT